MAPRRIIKLLPKFLRERRETASGIWGLEKPLKPDPSRWNVKAVGELVAGHVTEQINAGDLKQAEPKWKKSLVSKGEPKIVAKQRFVGQLRAILGARSSDMIEFYKYLGRHYLFVYPTSQVSEKQIGLHRNLGVAIKITNQEIIEALDYLG